MLIFAPHCFKCCNWHDQKHFFLDNGVMTTPKRRILSFVFTVLCLKFVKGFIYYFHMLVLNLVGEVGVISFNEKGLFGL